uniref:Uncharacterized protein n=1 Tax=Macrostomum lignano TaxID=282301 RepID=A0A1I8FCM0_9PLAT
MVTSAHPQRPGCLPWHPRHSPALLGLTFARGGTDSDFSVSDGLRVVLFLLELCVAVMQTALAGRYACCPASSAVAPNGGAPQAMSELAVTAESGRAPPAYPGWAAASWKVNVPSPPTYEEALAGPSTERPSLISFCPNLPLFLCRASPSVMAESPGNGGSRSSLATLLLLMLTYAYLCLLMLTVYALSATEYTVSHSI